MKVVYTNLIERVKKIFKDNLFFILTYFRAYWTFTDFVVIVHLQNINQLHLILNDFITLTVVVCLGL